MRTRAADREQIEAEELFVRYRETGDEEAFELVYDAFGQRLFAIAVRFFRGRNGTDSARALAIDAAQETWLQIVRCRRQWSGSRGTLGAWIMSIHYHCLLQGLRRPPPPGIAVLDGEDPAVQPELCLLAREALEQLSEALSPDDAEVLMAYYLGGGPRLLAASLGISEPTLRKRVERVKSALRRDPRFGDLLEAFTPTRAWSEESGR